jgi:DNA-binding CsgD family transcriptional regulator/PAS domain-containing protein
MRAAAATTLDRPIARNQVRFMPTELDSGLIVPLSHQRSLTEGEDFPAFSTLIGDIYDASVDPTRWRAVLVKLRTFIGGSGAAIFSKDATTKSLNVHYDCGGVDPYYHQLYVEKYEKIDPSTTAHVLSDVEQTISTIDVMPFDQFYATRFYREWGEPQGLVDFAAAVLDKTATGAALFGVFRRKEHGVVDEDTRWRMSQLVPHIRRAVTIGRVIELKTAQAATFADTFDGLSAAMFLVDDAGRVVHVNASGYAMLRDATVLRSAGNKLVATDPKAALALAEVFAVAGKGDAAVGIKGIAVPLSCIEGDCYTAHVLPLSSGARQSAGASYAAVAAVFVRKAEVMAPSLPEVIAKHYRLTPTELRVLLAIVQVGGVPETAEALGIGEATVKTHLHRLFSKTGTTRQADLVKLVAGFANPLVR